MSWLRIRFDPGELGSPGSFPWQAWPSKSGRLVTIYDAHGDVLAVISGGGENEGERLGRERAIIMGRLLEELSWAMREDEGEQRERKCIARTLSDGRLWAAADEHGGGRWWRRILRKLTSG